MLLRPAALLALVLALIGLSACQRADEEAGETGATTLTVYASLPLQGPQGPDSRSTADGIRLALREAGGKAGELTVKLVVLDDSTPKAGRWDPEQTAENARRVVRDRTAIAYLGDGPSGATAISLPILNSAGVLQVSPTSGYTGLTRTQDADKGEPEKYYPSGVRTFARPVPADDVQARALLAAMSARSCARLRVLDDRDVAGRGLANAVQRRAEEAGFEITGRDELRPDADPAARLAAAIAGDGTDCVVFAGALADWVPPLFDAIHAAAPRVRLFGSDGLASDGFAAALAPGTQARTTLTAPVGVLEPTPGVERFGTRFREAFGVAPRTGAIYGYEAMRLVLAAMRKAGDGGANRERVRDALFALGPQSSPLGRYAITRSGDTDGTRFTRLEIEEGELARKVTSSFP